MPKVVKRLKQSLRPVWRKQWPLWFHCILWIVWQPYCIFVFWIINRFITWLVPRPIIKQLYLIFDLIFAFIWANMCKFRVLSVLKVRWLEKTMLPPVSGDSDWHYLCWSLLLFLFSEGKRTMFINLAFSAMSAFAQGGRSCAGARVATAEKIGLGWKF